MLRGHFVGYLHILDLINAQKIKIVLHINEEKKLLLSQIRQASRTKTKSTISKGQDTVLILISFSG
jgi:hypothetical protein